MDIRLTYKGATFKFGGINCDDTVADLKDMVYDIDEWAYDIIKDEICIFEEVPCYAVQDFYEHIMDMLEALYIAYQDDLEGDDKAIPDFVEYYGDGFYLGNLDIEIEFSCY